MVIGALAAVVLVMPTKVNAQDRPEDIARAAFAAFERQDWNAVVKVVDAAAAVAFRESELALIAAWLDQREAMRAAKREGVTSFGFSSDGILKPEQLARLRNVRVEAFAGAPTFAELAALPPEEFLRRWLQAVHSGQQPAVRLPAGVHRRTLGVVIEGDTLAHVVYRPEGGDMRYEHPWTVEVLALRKDSGVWRILLPSQDLAWSVRLMQMLHEPDEP
jgi:hypothetical protein